MSLRKQFWLVLIVGSIVVPGTLSVAADNSKFPTSYDPKVLKKIEESPRSYFVSPDVTTLDLDSTVSANLNSLSPFVWLQLKIGSDFSVKETKVVYCSEPGKGLEQIALDSVRARECHPVDEHENWRWLWHRVEFIRNETSLRYYAPVSSPDDEFIETDVQPKMLYEKAPIYPKAAKDSGLAGVVWVKAVVDKFGKVREAIVGSSSGHAALDSAAVVAAYGNRFSPAIQRGDAVAVWVTYKVVFKMNE